MSILTQRDRAVVTVTLNLPEMRNPVSDNAVIDALMPRCTRPMAISACAR